MAENVFNEDVEFLIRVRDAVAEKDRLTAKASELKGVLKKQEKELASEEKSVQDEIASTTKKRRGEVEEGFDKQISVIKSKKKKAESEKEKTIDAGRESRIREEAREHVEDSKEAEKELKKLFRKNKVPRFARTKLFYVMFMPDGPLEFAMMLVSYLVLLAGIPALITWLVRILFLKDASDKTKTILTILIPSVLIVIFLLIIFMIYVKVKARHRETLRLGRKYRNMVSRNDRKIREIKRDIENDTDESLYDLEAVNQKLDEIYKTYGYCLNTLHSYRFEGSKGFAKMQEIMRACRERISAIGGKKVVKVLDYAQGLDGLPKSDVLKFLLEDNCSVVVRPSGTEPKLKIYLSVTGG